MSGRFRSLIALASTAIAVLLPFTGCSSTPDTAPIATSSRTASPAPTPTTSPPSPLTSTASVTRRHPKPGTRVGVVVSTAPGALITVVAHFGGGSRKKTAYADTARRHTLWFPVGSAMAGVKVTVDVWVSAQGQKRSTRIWFTPRQPPPPPAAPAVTFGCNILRTGAGQEEFNVTTTGGGTYSGAINVSFYDYAGSGHIFPPTSVQGATPVGSWRPVPAADIGASAEPSGCVASAG